MRTDAGYFEDTFRNSDIAMYTETHQCTCSRLPDVTGFWWELAFRPQPLTASGTRGSGGVVVLFHESMRERVLVVHRDADARYMWIRIYREGLRDLYAAICYFPPAYSQYAPDEGSSYAQLYDDIMRFDSLGDIMLSGDFNA